MPPRRLLFLFSSSPAAGALKKPVAAVVNVVAASLALLSALSVSSPPSFVAESFSIASFTVARGPRLQRQHRTRRSTTTWTLPPQTAVATVLAPSAAAATRLDAKAAGTFFNPVPGDDDGSVEDGSEDDVDVDEDKFQSDLTDLLRRRKSPSRASEPSTINGVPTALASKGFSVVVRGGAKSSSSPSAKRPNDAGTDGPEKKKKKPFVGVGPPLNDVANPETDDQGYTLYVDEMTGEKSRVFEALVEYPCEFTLKIVGANEGAFVSEMVAVVAESCQVEASSIAHSVRANGKWTSVTVQAPVRSAEMLYALYENVDRDPRVKFKF